MKQYLKMADVFVGEVQAKHIDEEGIAEIVHGEDSGKYWTIEDSRYWMATQYEHACYAAHAINSHDELVQMNQELLAALENTWSIIDSAGLYSLVNGVHLGQMSWLAKASDAKSLSEFIIAKAKCGAA